MEAERKKNVSLVTVNQILPERINIAPSTYKKSKKRTVNSHTELAID